MARTVEQIVIEKLGMLAMREAVLLAKVEELKERLAAQATPPAPEAPKETETK